jgi:hypothetical protein
MTKIDAEIRREPLAQLVETLHEIQIEKTRLWCESMQQRLDALVILGSSSVENVDPENREELLLDLNQIRGRAASLKVAYGDARTGKPNASERRKLDETFDDIAAIVENVVLLWRPNMIDIVDEALR